MGSPCGSRWTALTSALCCARTRLLADAEAGKDPAQEVVGGELAGDLVQGLLGAAKLFGYELAGAAVLELALSFVDVTAGAGEGLQVALASGDCARVECLIAHAE